MSSGIVMIGRRMMDIVMYLLLDNMYLWFWMMVMIVMFDVLNENRKWFDVMMM